MNNILIHIDRDGAANLASTYDVWFVDRILAHADTLLK
ncbi:hypothetical protein PATA110616_00150 [Paenibacillus tarimensis]